MSQHVCDNANTSRGLSFNDPAAKHKAAIMPEMAEMTPKNALRFIASPRFAPCQYGPEFSRGFFWIVGVVFVVGVAIVLGQCVVNMCAIEHAHVAEGTDELKRLVHDAILLVLGLTIGSLVARFYTVCRPGCKP
jgi:hypothetical protein